MFKNSYLRFDKKVGRADETRGTASIFSILILMSFSGKYHAPTHENSFSVIYRPSRIFFNS